MENIQQTAIKRPSEKWSDVKGMDHIKRELTFYATFNDKFAVNGVVLFGPPKTGKTKLARGLAGKFPELTFISMCGKSIRKEDIRILFDLARQHTPSILFAENAEEIIPETREELSSKPKKEFKEEFVRQMKQIYEESENILTIIDSDHPWKLDLDIVKTYFPADVYVKTISKQDQYTILKDALVKSKRFGNELDKESLTRVLDLIYGFNKQEVEELVVEAAKNRVKRYTVSAKCTHVRKHTITTNGFTYDWIPCCHEAENAHAIFTENNLNMDLDKIFVPLEFPMNMVDVLTGISATRVNRNVPPVSFFDSYNAFQKWLYKSWNEVKK